MASPWILLPATVMMSSSVTIADRPASRPIGIIVGISPMGSKPLDAEVATT